MERMQPRKTINHNFDNFSRGIEVPVISGIDTSGYYAQLEQSVQLQT